jgi:5-methylcytosine-specific restriction enzyme A
MPYNPPTFRPRGAPSRLEQKRTYDRVRRTEQPWRRWYSLRVWKAIRAAQLIGEPCCRRCTARGLTVIATVVHHQEPHRGNWKRFISGPFESLCSDCHDREAQADEAASRLRGGEGG